MSDQDNSQDNLEQDQETAAAMKVAELESLKTRAELMGVKFHPAISAEKLREKISAHLAAETNPAEPAGMPAAKEVYQAVDPAVEADPDAPAQVASASVVAIENANTDSVKYVLNETPAQKRKRIRQNATELVRIKVTCMNPAKKDWAGEIITVGNSAVGTLKKFVPFNNEEGWHVPRMILEVLQGRQCQIFVNGKAKNGIKTREGKLIKEFGIEIMPALTEEELSELARRQAMAAGKAE